MSDLTKLSDDELAAAFTLLGEQAHQITIGQEKIRDEQTRRMLTADADKHDTFDDWGSARLDEAVAAAPAKAVVIAEAVAMAAEAAAPAKAVVIAEAVVDG